MDLPLHNRDLLNKTFKIIGLYIVGFLCLGLFLLIDNSPELREFLEKTDKVRTHTAFGFYAIIGLVKLSSLIAGLTLPLILTIMLIRQRIKKNKR